MYMLNRDYLNYIASLDDDFKCLLDFNDTSVLKSTNVSQEIFEYHIEPYIHDLNIEALYCLCIYTLHLISNNKVWATYQSKGDVFFNVMSKLRGKSITKISFYEKSRRTPISIDNSELIRFIVDQLDNSGIHLFNEQSTIQEVKVSEYLNVGNIRDMLTMIITTLIEHEINQKITPQYKELVVRILYLFQLRQEITPSEINKYCEREVFDSIRSKAKVWRWFPLPNSKENPYPSPQQIEAHDRFKGKKVPRRSPKRS